MADPLPNADRDANNTPPGIPTWVKVLGLVLLIGVLLMGIIMIASGGKHGPGQHMPSGHAWDVPVVASITLSD
jgi:hypothetical protein